LRKGLDSQMTDLPVGQIRGEAGQEIAGDTLRRDRLTAAKCGDHSKSENTDVASLIRDTVPTLFLRWGVTP
jgi:hypothetical protein